MYITRARILYRATLVGSFAGLCAWLTSLAIPFYATARGIAAQHTLERVDASLVGLFLTVFCIYNRPDDQYGRRAFVGRIFVGIVCGALLGAAAAECSIWLRGQLGGAPSWTGGVLTWSITGLLVGVLVGFARYRFLLRHVMLSAIGGASGAILGSFLIVALGDRVPYWTRCIGLMLAGAAIGFTSACLVGLARGAVLTLLAPHGPRVFGLLRGNKLQFGSGSAGEVGCRFVHLDADLGRIHGGVYWRDGQFYAEPNAGICGWDHRPLLPFLAGNPPVPVIQAHLLQHNDIVQMGSCRFQFTLRVIAFLLLAWTFAPARAEGPANPTLVLAEPLQLLRAAQGSDIPLFRATFNLRNSDGSTAHFPVFSSAEEADKVTVLEGAARSAVCSVTVGALPRRYTLVLLDVSGSMLEPLPSGGTKFDAMIEAALHLVDRFVEGADYIAVAPFGSHQVIQQIEEARFFTTAENYRRYVKSVPRPLASSNTGLFTAARTGADRLLQLKQQYHATGQYLLLVMTDGINDVRRSDDPGLDSSIGGASEFLTVASIPVITVGFGNAPEMERDLRALARPDARNYYPAPTSDALVAAFRDARNSQVDRLRVTFRPQAESFTQLIHERKFHAIIKLPGELEAAAQLIWAPPPVVVPEDTAAAEEADCYDRHQTVWWCSPWFLVGVLGLIHYLLCGPVQQHFWGTQDAAEHLIARLRTPEAE